MSRNNFNYVNNRYAKNPIDLDRRRSIFDLSFEHKTTFNTGQLIPMFMKEVLPGDTFKIKTSAIVRGSTPIHPTMDNAFIDIAYFFVPNRLVWDHWPEFLGANTEGPWVQTKNFPVPTVNVKDGESGFAKGSLVDYMGVTTDNLPGTYYQRGISALPFRAYAAIVNEWYLDENIQTPCIVFKGDDPATHNHFTEPDSYIVDLTRGGMPFVVAKVHDYFTSALPDPQKGPKVGFSIFEDTPVVASTTVPKDSLKSGVGLTWANTSTKETELPSHTSANSLGITGDTGNIGVSQGETVNGLGLNNANKDYSLAPNNLWALTSQVGAVSVEELRTATAIQRFFEVDARNGTRIQEFIFSHFGVKSPDARLQIPEYLGGSRFNINTTQVIQTSSTDSVSPQGNTSAFSLTGINNHDSVFKSFTEHGILLGLCYVRTDQTYQNGIPRSFTRFDKFDYAFPELVGIGEQSIMSREISVNGLNADDMKNKVFGYTERYGEYKCSQNMVTGAFRSNAGEGTLDSWHYANNFTGPVTLSNEFIRQNTENVDRTLAVKSTIAPQWIADFYFDVKATRCMPRYNLPGIGGRL